MFIFRGVILLILLSNTAFVLGQQSFSINVNKQSGIPSSIVYDFHQDKKGFIWIASNEGITRYDGFEFITYNSENQTSLAGSAIQEDKYGRIWYQNFDGYLYYVKDEQLFSLSQNLPGEYVPFGIIKDYLFVVQQNGVDIFNLKTLNFIKSIKIDVENVLASTVMNDAFYFLAENKIYKLDSHFKLSTSSYFIERDIKVNRLNNNGKNLFLCYRNRDEHIYYFLDKDLNYLKTNNYSSTGRIFADQFLDGNYWIYTNKGFFVYDEDEYLILSNDELKLDVSINKCIVDKNGSYWFSSLSNGLYIINDFGNKIYSFDEYALRYMCKKQDGYLISTRNGQIIEVDKSYEFVKKVVDLGKHNQILNFYYDESSDLLFYTTSYGMHILHQNKEIYYDDIATKNVLKVDDKYYAIAGSGRVMLLLNPIVNHPAIASKWDLLFNTYAENKLDKTAILMSNIRAKSVELIDDGKQFLVATNVGLNVFNQSGRSGYLVDGKQFYGREIYAYNKKLYLLDNNGNLYVQYRSGKTTNLNAEIGIPQNGIYFIKRFENILYIVCANRIFEYDLTYATSKTFSFNTNMLIITDLVKTKENLVLVAGNKLTTIGLNKKSLQDNIPFFYLNNYYVDNEKVLPEDLLYLKFDDNSIKVTYSLLDYGSNQEPLISYRLNKGEWIKLTAGTREIQLVALTPNEYVLEFKMNNIILKEKVTFKIHPPIYLTWWFITLIVILVIALVILIYSWRLFAFRKKIKQLNEKIILENKLRTSMLTSIKAQMNPHFFYNALNTIQAYIFSNDKFNATTYLAKFSKLTRMILEMSGQPSIKLEDEIASLNLYLSLEQMRFQTDFNFEIIEGEGIDKKNIRIPAMLIQPYVENAVKHGLLHKAGQKSLKVQFNYNNELLEVIIDDNGVGRKRSEEINSQKFDKPNSFSTKSNETRLNLINHDKNIVSVQFEDKYNDLNESLGTKVTLFISKSDYEY